MVSVNPTNAYLTTAETDVECPPIDGRELLDGLRQQLALSDRLGLDLVSIRIAESLDQLVAELEGADALATSRHPHQRH